MSSERLGKLRKALQEGRLDGFFIGREDMFQGEEVPPSEERLAYISGFTGSAGFALVLEDKAAIFSDGRYTLQMASQTDPGLWETFTLPEEGLDDYLGGCQLAGKRIGIDPRLVSKRMFDSLSLDFIGADAELVRDTSDAIDGIWGDERPPSAASRPFAMPERLAGQGTAEKLEALDEKLLQKGCDAVVVSRADAVNWLLNLRGRDLDHTPINLAFAFHHRKEGTTVLAPPHGVEALRSVLEETGLKAAGIEVAALEEFASLIDGGSGDEKGKRVMVDTESLPCALHDLLRKAGAMTMEDDCQVTKMKALKNAAELDGTRRAHVEDGAIMARFLCWLDSGSASGLRESEIAERLLGMRKASPRFLASSFETICGAGPNGAIVHYRAAPGQDAALPQDNLLLVDSGAHYEDGTTDITRTIAVGNPSEEMRHAFTAVLRGHIALATARFPKGTAGQLLDTIARAPLWSSGLDYAHGTGHGVGHVLQVHEGPANISKRGAVPLEAGMLLSNEPGHYRVGEWGIRTENLVVVREAGTEGYLEFETVTLCPIDSRLIELKELQDSERAWLNEYHARVLEEIARELEGEPECLAWLEAACKPI